MYGIGRGGDLIGSTVVTSSGVVMLPATGGNTFGTLLAYAAITIGGAALISQLIVRIVRRKYNS
jgi:hypothetical protein